MDIIDIYKLFPIRKPVFAPKEFRYDTDIKKSWNYWECHFNEYHRRHNYWDSIEVIYNKKLPHMKKLVGEKLRTDLKSKNIDIDVYRSPDAIQTIVRSYLWGVNDVTLILQNEFFTCFQEENENIDDYYSRLLTHLEECRFGGKETILLAHQVAFGVYRANIRESILKQSYYMYMPDAVAKIVLFIRRQELSKKSRAKKIVKKPIIGNKRMYAQTEYGDYDDGEYDESFEWR